MAHILRFTRAEAASLPLTTQTVTEVITRSRRAVLAQLALSAALVAGLVWIADHSTGWLSGAGYAAAALAMWGVLATVLSAWDHFRVSLPLKKIAASAIARERDPKRFWWAYRGVFPLSWTGAHD